MTRWALLLAVLLAPNIAAAQNAPSNRNFVVQKFQPEGGYYDVLGVQSARVAPNLKWGLWAYVNESHQIVRLVQDVGNASVSLLTDQLMLDVGGTIGFLDIFELSLAIPVALWEQGRSAPFIDSTLAREPAPSGLSDIRLMPRAHLVDAGGFHLGVGVPLSFPTGRTDTYLTYHAVTATPELLLELDVSIVRILLNAGFSFRPSRQFVQARVASSGTYGGALEVAFHPSWQGLLAVQGEYGVNQASTVNRPVELQLAAKWLPSADNWGLLVGGGTGFTRAFGAPMWRVFLGGYWHLSDKPPPDSDGDGVLDENDLCPNQPAGEHPDPKRPGCPEPDSDGDGLLDGKDQCPQVPAGKVPDPAKPGCPDGDADNDGVPDSQDRCPGVAAGPNPDPNRPGCPEPDSDGDGVVDSKDHCPTQHATQKSDPEKPGCPAPDRDGDTVPDMDDACPDKPGAPSRDPKKNGCPGLVKMKGSEIQTLKPIQFATGTANLLPPSYPILAGIMEVMWAHPEFTRISIEGHTDDKGDFNKNMKLSQARAASCMDYLIKMGVAADKFESHGFGSTKPIADNKTNDGRSQNRRVEFHIVQSPAAAGDPNAAPVAPSNP